MPRDQEPQYRHVRVILTAGLLEPFDEEEARRAGCDAILKKPFEASVVMQTIRPLVHDAQLARGLFAEAMAARPTGSGRRTRPPSSRGSAAARSGARRGRDHLALDAALPALVREITEKVLVALGH